MKQSKEWNSVEIFPVFRIFRIFLRFIVVVTSSTRWRCARSKMAGITNLSSYFFLKKNKEKIKVNGP